MNKDLYCVNCGVIIYNKYQGEVFCFTHLCGRKPENLCTVLATEDAPLCNSSFLSCDLSSSNCSKCNTQEEHIEKVIQSYLGKNYTSFVPSNPLIKKIKENIIHFLKIRAL